MVFVYIFYTLRYVNKRDVMHVHVRTRKSQICICAHRSGLVKRDHYAVAAASMELGLVYIDLGMLVEAEKQLHSAKLACTCTHIQICTH